SRAHGGEAAPGGGGGDRDARVDVVRGGLLPGQHQDAGAGGVAEGGGGHVDDRDGGARDQGSAHLPAQPPGVGDVDLGGQGENGRGGGGARRGPGIVHERLTSGESAAPRPPGGPGPGIGPGRGRGVLGNPPPSFFPA